MTICLFGIIVMARALFAYDLVANASRLGARWASVRGSGCTVPGCPTTGAAVKSFLLGVSPGVANSLGVATSWASGAGCTDAAFQGRACLVTVTVTYPFRFAYPLKLAITMSSSSTMAISQ